MAASGERERFLALLESRHRFPGPYWLSVITVNDDHVRMALRAAIDAALEAAVDAAEWETRPSRGGRYASHRVTVTCQSAAEVLALYESVRRVTGVVTVL